MTGPLRITLVRHGQSEANLAQVWQGQGDAALSPEGVEQAKRLAARLAGRDFDLVVASDLARAADTARAVADHRVELDPAWREMDIGAWEGKTFEEVRRLHPDLLEAIRNGEAVAFGRTGETLADFESRILEALRRLAQRVGEGDVLVVTHGGVIDAVVGSVLGRVAGRRTFPIVANTALTVLEGTPDGLRLRRFNDATHVEPQPTADLPMAAFVRHGVTSANKEQRIQGQSCWGLDEDGHRQAAALAAWYGPVDRVVSSPLQRALETARAFGVEVETDDDLKEMGFGAWEGLRYRDLRASSDPLARRIYHDGEDLPRGGSGESFAQLTERVSRFLGRFRPDPGSRTVVVSHGAAIRALVASVCGRSDVWRRLVTPDNTSVTHIAWSDEGPMLWDFCLAPHLER